MIVNHATTLAAPPDTGADSGNLRSLLRWPILIAASLALVIFTLGRAASVGAAAPTAYDSTICINYFTCYNTGTGAPVSVVNSGYPAYVAPAATATGYPANTVVSSYFDPRYGFVSVVADATGNLIDVNTATGQRIFPVFPDYGYGFGNGFVGNTFIGGNFTNGFVNNGCPVGNFSCLGTAPFFGGTYADIFAASGCAFGDVACLGYVPAGFSTGYTGIATTTTGTTSTGVTTVTRTVPGQGQVVIYNPREVAQPTVAAPAAQPVAAPASAAPTAGMATALNAPLTQAPAASPGGGDVKVFSAPTTTAPAATNDGRDDGR